MTTFRGVIEFVRFVASVLKMRISHFLFDCPKYSSIRDDFFNKIDIRIPNYKHILISTLIIQLMNSSDYYLNKQVVQYVSSCLEMRDNVLGGFRFDYEYEIEYEYDFRISNQ